MKIFAINVGDSHVSKIEMVDLPGRGIVDGFFESDPEKSELITEKTVLFIFQVSGVIPPFYAKLVVRKIIAGELVRVSGKRLFERFCPGR